MSSTGIKARLSHAQWSLKPQDLAMALKLVCLAGEKVIYAELARAMRLSVFEARACALLQQASEKVQTQASFA